jgi:hypothetical protein
VSGCHVVSCDRCSIPVEALDGPVDWRITGTSTNVSAGGSGHLPSRTTVHVTAFERDTPCTAPGSGSVSFSSGDTVSVTWDC